MIDRRDPSEQIDQSDNVPSAQNNRLELRPLNNLRRLNDPKDLKGTSVRNNRLDRRRLNNQRG